MKFPSFFRFGSSFLAFIAPAKVVTVNTYPFHISVAVRDSFPIVEGAVCISEQEFTSARNEALLLLGLVDYDAQLIAQIEAYETEQELALPC